MTRTRRTSPACSPAPSSLRGLLGLAAVAAGCGCCGRHGASSFVVVSPPRSARKAATTTTTTTSSSPLDGERASAGWGGRRGSSRRARRRASKAVDTTTSLFGINEWRDGVFLSDGGASQILSGDDVAVGTLDVEDGSYYPDGTFEAADGYDEGLEGEEELPAREICVLPFPVEDVILQGETKQLRLYEDRFIQLFGKCMDEHCGVLAMGLIAGNHGIVQTVPLCEVEAYNRMGGDLGIFVTVRCVGRARLLDIVTQEPYISAVCAELPDRVPPSLDFPNLVASNIENAVVTLASLRHKLEKSGGDTDSLPELELDDDDEDDEDEPPPADVNGQFQRAFHRALDSDCQGYTVSTAPPGTVSPLPSGQRLPARSARNLAAISWAAFCVNGADANHRLQALDCEDVFDRLKLGAFMLREMRGELEAKVALDGIDESVDE